MAQEQSYSAHAAAYPMPGPYTTTYPMPCTEYGIRFLRNSVMRNAEDWIAISVLYACTPLFHIIAQLAQKFSKVYDIYMGEPGW